MQKQTYTKQDLKQVIQKLIDDKQKGKPPRIQTSLQDAPSREAVSQETSSQDALSQNTLSQIAPSQDAPLQTVSSQVAPIPLEVSTPKLVLQAEQESEKDRQIALLKTALKTIAEKLKEATASSSSSSQYQKEVAALQEELSEAKVKWHLKEQEVQTHTQEISRLAKAQTLLLDELKEQTAKNSSFERIKTENEKFKARLQEAERALFLSQSEQKRVQEGPRSEKELEEKISVIAKLQDENIEIKSKLERKEAELQDIQGQSQKTQKNFEESSALKAHFEKELAEYKARSLHLSTLKQELENTVNALTFDRDQALLQLNQAIEKRHTQDIDIQDLKNKHVFVITERDELKRELQNKDTQIASSLNFQEKAKKENAILEQDRTCLRQELDALLMQKTQIEETARDSITQLREKLLSTNEENNFLKSEIETKDVVLETMRKQHEKDKKEIFKLSEEKRETQNQLLLFEQHLARRVKECAILSNQLEEQTLRQSEIYEQNEQQKQKIQEQELNLIALQETYDQFSQQKGKELKTALEDLVKWQAKYESLFATWEAQGKELIKLKAVQERYLQLEQLLGEFSEIISSPQTSFDAASQILGASLKEPPMSPMPKPEVTITLPQNTLFMPAEPKAALRNHLFE